MSRFMQITVIYTSLYHACYFLFLHGAFPVAARGRVRAVNEALQHQLAGTEVNGELLQYHMSCLCLLLTNVPVNQY